MWFPTAFLPFVVTLSVLCFGIGWFVLSSLFRKNSTLLTIWEKVIFSFALSQSVLIFGMIAIGEAGINLNVISLALFLTLLTAFISLVFSLLTQAEKSTEKTGKHVFTFSKKQSWLFLFLIGITLLVKTIYLTHTILPTSTDLGHHLYWAKAISETGELPFYAEQNIVTDPASGFRVTPPEPISDFIIGEHLMFAAINIISGASYFSAFPILFLHLINILSLLALAVLAYYLVRSIKLSSITHTLWTGENAFLATLFLFGPLYSIGSPQSKFISGGVVGNTFGNLFIPLILLCFYRALRTKDSRFLGLGLIFSWTLAYIHHLSTFILLFILVATILTHIAFHIQKILPVFKQWGQLLIKPFTLATLSTIGLFFFFVAMPTYIETNAVGTAVGTPTRTTRTGLTFDQITNSVGAPRFALALASLFFFAFILKTRTYARSFLLAWMSILLIMTLRPDFLLVDIPSSRIGAYLSFPIGISASISLLILLSYFKQYRVYIPRMLSIFIPVTIFLFILSNGSFDNASSLATEDKSEPTVNLIHATDYLAAHTSTDDRIVKDHNFIVGDAWMKLFFMRGYSYPFSRAYFNRYETNPDREHCTLYMISTPSSKDGERCFQATGVNFVVVDSIKDTAQFNTAKKFSKIYSSRYITIYQRNIDL
jgi:hypothetical protein